MSGESRASAYEEPVDSELVPIREISRLTGVNTVTLRAWERRYGLLVPQRTGKGHRLYSRADIERVKEVQLWLGRGLAISKVKALLASQPQEQQAQVIDSNWLQLAQQIHSEINNFQRRSLQRILEDTFALYPAEMVADYLLLPLLRELEGDEPGMAARRAFFVQIALEVVIESQARQRQSASGAQLLLIAASDDQAELKGQLLAYSLLIHQFRVELLGYLNPREALLAGQALDAKIIVLLGYGDLNAASLQLHLNSLLEKSAVPLILVGDLAASMSAFDFIDKPRVGFCIDQQAAVLHINKLLNG
uniref:MerR family transcriptional regulator n=1 Tax=Cellvibrio fontiphilus TaxID=1815559 RepID=UPI002B4BD4EF|nr:MerR family transcriptional regulator [Cellvibrio fontiphilus]